VSGSGTHIGGQQSLIGPRMSPSSRAGRGSAPALSAVRHCGLRAGAGEALVVRVIRVIRSFRPSAGLPPDSARLRWPNCLVAAT
jgi:hypothetical protein